MNVKYSKRLQEMEKILTALPQRVQRPIMSVYRENAEGFIKIFKDGLRDESFHLKRLKVATIARKASAGFPQPETPLYGIGDQNKDRSYINMHRIRELKNGFKVYVSWARHWSGNIRLIDLYRIHEFGAMVHRGRGHKIIRIPARPAVARAHARFLKSEPYAKNAHRIIKIIMDYLKK